MPAPSASPRAHVSSDKRDSLQDHATRERWLAAQEWERQVWIDKYQRRSKHLKNPLWRVLNVLGRVPKYRGDDWNHWWRDRFNNYQFLPATAENAIEVGCGPYTNMRLMIERCQPKHLVLSDPLIRTYATFKLTFVSDLYRRGLCMLDDHPLEELPFKNNYFDLTVMINVLDHVQDARRCMDNLINVTRPGGIVVLGQDLSSSEEESGHSHTEAEIGHPIRLDREWFTPYLEPYFKPVLHEVLSREESRAKMHHSTLLFAGTKRAEAGLSRTAPESGNSG